MRTIEEEIINDLLSEGDIDQDEAVFLHSRAKERLILK
jgi:hypothetical protein